MSFSDRVKRFFSGRYYGDELGIGLIAISMVFWLIGRLTNWVFFVLVAALVLVLEILRMFSRNLEKRRRENLQFLKGWAALKRYVSIYWRALLECKTHKLVRCPNCRQLLRVPKGKGLVRITCTRCKHQFEKKT